jgi:hypothetical protein
VVDYRKISDRVEERDFEIELRNHKDEDVTIIVEKKLYGDWSIPLSNYDFTKKDANTVEFKVPVKANDKAVINFTFRTTR